MTDPKRLLDDDDLSGPEREALRTSASLRPPRGEREAVWARLAPLLPPGTPQGAPPDPGPPAGSPAGPLAGSPAASGAAGAPVASAASAATGALSLFKSAAVGAGLMAAALGAHALLSPPADPSPGVSPSGRPALLAPGPLASGPLSPGPLASPGASSSAPAPSAVSPDPEASAPSPQASAPASPRPSSPPPSPPSPASPMAAGTGPGEVIPSGTTLPSPQPGAAVGEPRPGSAGPGASGRGDGPAPGNSPAPEASAAVEAARAEAAMVAEARQALRSGNARGALGTLDELSRRFPSGVLGHEREALAIEALARSGQAAQARARAQAFVAAHPQSPFAARVRAFASP